jgi:hypothetical protein
MTNDCFIIFTHTVRILILRRCRAVDALARAVRDAGMSAIALTDHDSLAGAVRFYQAAMEVGVKPIIGVEFTVEPVLPGLVEDRERPPHLLLLAESNEGYSNLCRLVTAARLGEARRESAFSAAYAQVDRDHPLLSQENLRRHGDHLIALTACRKRGEIPSLLERGLLNEAQEVAGYYRNLFGPERMYVELHNHLLPRPHSRSRYRLAELAARVGLECVATNNTHYVEKSGYRLQDVMVCMGARQTVDEPNPERRPNAEFYLKTPRQMAELFADQPRRSRMPAGSRSAASGSWISTHFTSRPSTWMRYGEGMAAAGRAGEPAPPHDMRRRRVQGGDLCPATFLPTPSDPFHAAATAVAGHRSPPYRATEVTGHRSPPYRATAVAGHRSPPYRATAVAGHRPSSARQRISARIPSAAL